MKDKKWIHFLSPSFLIFTTYANLTFLSPNYASYNRSFFFFFACNTYFMGAQFPDQGSNLGHKSERAKF